MKRKLTSILTVLLSISITGIIAVQIIWIDNAIRVKDELFARNASEALQSTVNRLENIHDVMIINRMAFPDSAFFINRSRILPPIPLSDLPTGNTRQRFVFRGGNDPGGKSGIQIRFETDTLVHFSYDMKNRENELQMDLRSDQNKLEEVILFRSLQPDSFDSLMSGGLKRLDSLASVLDTLSKWQSAGPQIHVRANNLRYLTQKAVSEIVNLDKPDINPQHLKNILYEELQNRQIPISFEFGVVRDSSILLSSSGADSTELIISTLKTELYPNSLFRRNQHLSIYFPDREHYMYRSMSWLLIASFLFSAIVLVTFSMSVFLLLRHKKISEMKSDFINNMTHEFKTPIATIAVASDSLFNDKVLSDPQKVRYFSGMIRKENQRMDRQVEDILTIARLEKKELEFKWETFDVHEILNEAIDSIQVQVTHREGQILSVFEATLPMVVADRMHLTHAMFNLLDNANKYTVGTPRIIVRTKNTDKGVVISVTDNGTGMNRKVHAKIFERFYRQPSGNIHTVKGFGLGLSYTKAVVESCRGTIHVLSEPGKGSTFEVYLPGNL